jgi:hypothetical protein
VEGTFFQVKIGRAEYELKKQALTAAKSAFGGTRLEKRRVISYKLMGEACLIK